MRQSLFQASLLASGGLLDIFGLPGLVKVSLRSRLHLYMVFSLWTFVGVQLSLFYKDASHIGLGPTLITSA